MLIDIKKYDDYKKVLSILYANNIEFDKFNDPYEAVCTCEIEVAIDNVRDDVKEELDRDIDCSKENITRLSNELRSSNKFNDCLTEIAEKAEEIVYNDDK